jgi:hypothetical protein
MPNLDILNMAQPIKDPIFKYITVYPNGRRFRKQSRVIGNISDARWLRDMLVKATPLGTKIEMQGMVDEAGKVMPKHHQPELFTSAWPSHHDNEHLSKLSDAGRITFPPPGPPRGFTFIEDGGEELDPEPGSLAAKAAEKGEKLLGLGHKSEEVEGQEPRKLWMPPPSKAGAAVIEEAKAAADSGKPLEEEEPDLPSSQEAEKARIARQKARGKNA